jgi:glucose-1-phosphate thymidylyltransferase
VNVLLLAAGYATRLRPLTEIVAKPLLPVGGRPMIDWILDRIEASGQVDGVHVVTNSVYADDFARWAEGNGVVVHDDGTSSNEDRLGALGDIRFAVRSDPALAGDDLLVIAADNLFEFALADYIAFWRSKGDGSALAVHRLPDRRLASLYGVAELDPDDRIVAMEEKPEDPRSDVIATAMYMFSRAHVALLDRYLDEGNAPDPPGRFISWLCEREPVYGFRFSEPWLDIGDPEQLLQADNRYRAAAGLPPRREYSLTG